MKYSVCKEEKHRLIVLSDLENEPDDTQSMVKLMMYSNEVEIEGLIAVTSCWLQHTVYPETITNIVQAYGIVRNNLMKHAQGWPSAEELLKKVAPGQTGYGMDSVGKGKSSLGSELIIKAVDRDDERPVYIAINAGSNTLAQAIYDVSHTRSEQETQKFIKKLRVYDDSGQDNAGAWMCHNFPDLFYIRSKTQVFGLLGPTCTSGPQPWLPMDQWDWTEKNIRVRHGILGALYPQRIFKKRLYEFAEGGNSTTWFGLVNKGLYDPEHPYWGGWGGRVKREKEQVFAGQAQVSILEDKYVPFAMYPQDDDWSWTTLEEGEWDSFSGVRGTQKYTVSTFAPLWRWRNAYVCDFAARMDWCVSDYEHANHPPRAVIFDDDTRGIVIMTVNPGEKIILDASKSYDPDGNELSFHWLNYPEAGTYSELINLENTDKSKITFMVPEAAAKKSIHIILELTNQNGIMPFTVYRRIVINVE